MILASAGGEIDRYREIMLNAGGAAERMATIMDDNLGGSLRAAESSDSGDRPALSSAIGPNVRKVVDSFTAVAQSIAAFIDRNPEVAQSLAMIVGGSMATAAALLVVSGCSVADGLRDATAQSWRPSAERDDSSGFDTASRPGGTVDDSDGCSGRLRWSGIRTGEDTRDRPGNCFWNHRKTAEGSRRPGIRRWRPSSDRNCRPRGSSDRFSA